MTCYQQLGMKSGGRTLAFTTQLIAVFTLRVAAPLGHYYSASRRCLSIFCVFRRRPRDSRPVEKAADTPAVHIITAQYRQFFDTVSLTHSSRNWDEVTSFRRFESDLYRAVFYASKTHSTRPGYDDILFEILHVFTTFTTTFLFVMFVSCSTICVDKSVCTKGLL